ncbi:MAG: EamA family transporter [Clostridiaceae bacterium]|nr:EamA family transporter [Clostridiaceae bacterium]
MLYFYLIKKVRAVKTLTVTYIVPVFGMLWGIIFLSESLRLQNIIGLVIIVFSILIVNNQLPTFIKKSKLSKSA